MSPPALRATTGNEKLVVMGTVIANILHVRAKPGQQYEVVNRLHNGDRVQILTQMDKWLGIRAPAETEAWVSVNQLKQDKITSEMASVYSGPGTIFSSYHNLEKGEEVKISKIMDNQWAQIEVPKDAIVWVHSNYIKYPPFQKELEIDQSPEEKIQPAEEEKSDDVTAEMAPAEAPEESSKENPEEIQIYPMNLPERTWAGEITPIGNKTEVIKSGTVIPLDEKHQPFKYALAKKINLTYFPLAYLVNSKTSNLHSWVRKPVTISGQQGWMRGWPRPRIEVTSIKYFDEKEGKFDK